jgi:phosphomannomutase
MMVLWKGRFLDWRLSLRLMPISPLILTVLMDFYVVTMVTASHNPPGYNGVKVDAIFADLKLDENDVTDIINSPLKTMELVDRIVKG